MSKNADLPLNIKTLKKGGLKTALLFGGQGDRTIHSALLHGLKKGVPLLERTIKNCGYTPEQVLNSRGRELESNSILQPVHVALLLIDAMRLKEEGVAPDYVAGHSLGELAAWAFAGAISFDDAVKLAAVRGRAMGRVAREHKGGMLALTDIDEVELETVLAMGRMQGRLDPAAYNAPREVVLTGSDSALRAVAPLSVSRRLNVAGPWHSPLMEEAKPEFAAAIAVLPPRMQVLPVISGVNGACLRSADDMSSSLVSQLTTPIRWTAVLKSLISMDVEQFVVAGPSRVLRYLVRQNLPSSDVIIS